MKKIMFVTGSRAEYGLLKLLIKKFESDSNWFTSVAVTGSHLSKLHGYTITDLTDDHIKNIFPVDLQIAGDTMHDICKAIGQGMNGFSELFNKERPHLIVVLGDRYELWSATIAAVIHNIPIAHIHGGESTEGLIDEMVRHSITKMAHLHFCSHETYKKRKLLMGENPEHVHLVGATGLDRIKLMNFLSKKQLETELGVIFNKKNILCTFHPITLSQEQSNQEIKQLVESLEEVIQTNDTNVIITLPNADTFSNYIREMWLEFANKHPKRVWGFSNLGDLRYLSVMNAVDVVLGNSSSGIIEAPFLNKAIIDIGPRQQGRLKSVHILSSDGSKKDIISKLNYALSEEFRSNLTREKSIYGDGNSCEKIYSHINSIDLTKLKYKSFHWNVDL